MNKKKTVVICQDTVIKGGRLSVLLDFIKVFNELDYDVTVMIGRCYFDPSKWNSYYGYHGQFNVMELNMPWILKGELRRILFNFYLRFFISKRFDYVVNCTNTTVFVGGRKNIFNYIFFPRAYRVQKLGRSIHVKDAPSSPFVIIDSIIGWIFYRIFEKYEIDRSLSNSHFSSTKIDEALVKNGKRAINLEVIYPAIRVSDFEPNLHEAIYKEQKTILVLGRITSDKNQYEIIDSLKDCNEWKIYIVGFADENSTYYQKCKAAAQASLCEICFIPNAELVEINKIALKCRFVIHGSLNDPFGMTTIQALFSDCIPVVPAVGGQAEIINNRMFHYKDVSELKSVLDKLSSTPKVEMDKLLKGFQERCKQKFSEDFFMASIKKRWFPNG